MLKLLSNHTTTLTQRGLKAITDVQLLCLAYPLGSTGFHSAPRVNDRLTKHSRKHPDNPRMVTLETASVLYFIPANTTVGYRSYCTWSRSKKSKASQLWQWAHGRHCRGSAPVHPSACHNAHCSPPARSPLNKNELQWWDSCCQCVTAFKSVSSTRSLRH